jgi:hypothetical protein
MHLRAAAVSLALVALWAPSAGAEPLGGQGVNIEPVAHLPIGDGQKNEIELAGDYAYVSWDGGLTIVDISDPRNPKEAGVWKCPGGWADVDLSADAKIAVLANGHSGTCATGGSAATIVDVSDPAKPRAVGKINLDDQIEYVHTTTLDGTTLYLNPQIWAGYPQSAQHITMYDISAPAEPKRLGFIEYGLPAVAHDTYVDHRPDGKVLMYAASIHTAEVIDLTKPLEPVTLQQVLPLEFTISHQTEPNHDRSMIVAADESAVDVGAPVGAICGRAGGPGPLALDIGSVHFYAAEPDGTYANGGLVPLGSWNTPLTVAPSTCTAHVFWLAPDENRLTQAWYTEGAHVLDFSDPADVKDLGSFKADKPTEYWSVKPHRGYLFATSQDYDALDILKYTGEGGSRWPATAGPAEIQRAARQGVPYKPLVTGSGQPVGTNPLPPVATTQRDIGRVRFTAKLKKLPGRKGKKAKVTFTFVDAKRKKVGSASVRKAAGKKARVRILGGAVAGTYRWTAKVGRRTVGRGTIRVSKTGNMTLAPSRTLSVTAR